MSAKTRTVRTGTFEQFKDYTLAVARGEREVDPSEPKIWIERHDDALEGQTEIDPTRKPQR